MKQLTCEMCGGTDLVKQDGMFICQSCGTKYSVEEAKKMMVEGIVKIDNSEKLNNLYKLARQAKESNDAENAVKYYDLIMQEEPNSWEAYFYNVYFRATQTKILFIESAANSIKNCLNTVFDLIKNNEDSVEMKKLQVGEVAVRVKLICNLFVNSAKNSFVDSWNGTFGKYDSAGSVCMKYAVEYARRAITSYLVLFTCGNLIERDYSDDSKMIELACSCWKNGVEIWKNIYALYDDHATRYRDMNTSYISKIKKYEPGYSVSAPQYYGFPRAFASILEKNSRKDFGLVYSSNVSSSNTSSSSSNNSSEGCYVATAVYGSYDCPQVWTLRRYRDNILAETWYGRAFIRTYYAVSPTLVKWFGHTDWFKKMWQGKLDRMVEKLQSIGVESTPYEDKKW